MRKSCLSCSSYLLGCRNPKKAVNYSCSDYKALKDHADIFSLLDKFETAPATAKPKPKIIRVHKKLVTADALGNFPPPDDDDPRVRDDPFNQDDLADVWDKTKEAEYEKSLREDNDFYRAMRDGYDSLTNTVKDMRIDDGDFSLALNCYDFACNFMGKHAKKPFARQLWIMVVLAAEYCPRCAETSFLNVESIPVDADPDEVADRMCLLHHGVCPRCGTGKAEMILSSELRDFVELVACLGQRSGKTVVSNTLTAYWIHRILMIPPYSQLCSGVQDFSPITFTLVALSFSRAQKLLWSPLVAVFKTSNFFIEYHDMMKHQSRKYGVELMSLRKSSLFYAHKNLEIAPMGPMKRTLRGDTRCGASCDELGWFPLPPVVDEDADNGNPEEVEREIANADEVYVALDRSLMTIRSGVYDLYRKGYNHIPNGLGLYTSSPAAYRDKICTMLRESEGSVRSLGVNLPTWEVNPLISRDYPDIVESYRKNAVKAERDWGAKPPNLNAAIYSRETLAPLFTGVNHFAVTRVVTSTGKLYGRILPLKRKWSWPGSVLALDAGMVNNSFAYAVVNGRYQDNIIGADVTSVGEVMPSRETPINFPLMYEHCLKPLIKATNVKFVVADRWNSAMLLQTIERDFPGVLTFYVTLRAADFDKADADFINSGLVTMPVMETTMDEAERADDYRAAFSTPPKPASHLFLQFRTIRKTLINRTKGERNTDDIYRAVMLGLTCLRHPKMEETLRKSRLINTSVGITGIRPVVSGRAYGLLR